MMRILASSMGAVAVTLVMLTSPALGASKFTAAIAPPAPGGTASAPAPVDVDLKADIATDASGHPSQAVRTYTTALPAELVAALNRYGSCPRDTVINQGSAACPKDSIIGNGQFTVYVPQIVTQASSDRADLVKVADDHIMMWWHVSNPSELHGTLDATISREQGPFGPVITWDFAGAADATSFGLEARLQSFRTKYLRAGTVAASTPSSGSSSSGHKTTCSQRARKIKNATKRAAALRRCAAARRRLVRCTASAHKIKDATKRRAARRRCWHLKSTARARAATEPAAAYSPFMSTGCASGSWGFEARILYKDKTTNEKLDSSVPCSGGQPGGTSPVPGAPANPLCPPLCAAQRTVGATLRR